MKNKTVVPPLRFPEFQDTEGWEIKELGKVSDVRDGTHDSPKFFSTGKPLITSKNLLSDGALNLENVSFISHQDYEQINKRSQVDIGDILFGMIGTIGNPVMVKSEGFAIKNVALIKQQTELLNTFFVHFLNSEYIAKKFDILNTGNTQKFIALGVLRSLEVLIPKPAEQQKIAACLTSIDTLLTAQSDKLAALKGHKKGLMQQLFPAEGETVPRLRFAEFRDTEGWEEMTLFDLAINGFSNGVFNDPKKVGTGYKLINVLDMFIETSVNENKLSLVAISETEFLKNKVEFGDVFFTRSSLVAAGIAHSNIYLGTSNDITFDGHLIRLRPDTSIVLPVFLHYLVKTSNARSQMIAKGKTATMTTIGQADIASVNIKIPFIPEQQRIADCLSSLDALITSASDKLDVLKVHKKGLMQQLFPNTQNDVKNG